MPDKALFLERLVAFQGKVTQYGAKRPRKTGVERLCEHALVENVDVLHYKGLFLIALLLRG